MFIIEKPSAYRHMHNCVLGAGRTEREAWIDAYGHPMTPYNQRQAGAWAKEITDEEYEDRLFND